MPTTSPASSQFSLSSPFKGFPTPVALPSTPSDPWGSLTPTTPRQFNHLKVFLKPPHLLTPSAVVTQLSTETSTPPSSFTPLATSTPVTATSRPTATASATPSPSAYPGPGPTASVTSTPSPSAAPLSTPDPLASDPLAADSQSQAGRSSPLPPHLLFTQVSYFVTEIKLQGDLSCSSIGFVRTT